MLPVSLGPLDVSELCVVLSRLADVPVLVEDFGPCPVVHFWNRFDRVYQVNAKSWRCWSTVRRPACGACSDQRRIHVRIKLH
jgi:hypothetical protein